MRGLNMAQQLQGFEEAVWLLGAARRVFSPKRCRLGENQRFTCEQQQASRPVIAPHYSVRLPTLVTRTYQSAAGRQ